MIRPPPEVLEGVPMPLLCSVLAHAPCTLASHTSPGAIVALRHMKA